MPATLAPAATEGTKPPRKPRASSQFMVLSGDVTYKLEAEANSLKAARSKCEALPDGDYIIVTRRAKVSVKTETSKSVKVL